MRDLKEMVENSKNCDEKGLMNEENGMFGD